MALMGSWGWVAHMCAWCVHLSMGAYMPRAPLQTLCCSIKSLFADILDWILHPDKQTLWLSDPPTPGNLHEYFSSVSSAFLLLPSFSRLSTLFPPWS